MCTLNDNLAIKRLKLSGVLAEQANDEAGDESLVSHFDTTVAIVADVLKNFVDCVEKATYSEDVEITVEDVVDEIKKLKEKFIPAGHVITFTAKELDPLLMDAARAIVESNITTISYIQRKLMLGYNRAAAIMDQLHNIGCLTSMSHTTGARTLLWDMDQLDDYAKTSALIEDADEL